MKLTPRQTNSLSRRQRDNLQRLLDTIEKGRQLRRSDVGRVGDSDEIVVHSMGRSGIAEAFGVSSTAVGKWRDLPINPDKSYDLAKLVQDRIDSAGKPDDRAAQLKIEKLEAEIGRINEQTRRLREEVIPIDEHKAVLLDRWNGVNAAWKSCVRAMINDFVERDRDDVVRLFEELRVKLFETIRCDDDRRRVRRAR